MGSAGWLPHGRRYNPLSLFIEELKPGQIRIGVPRPQFWEGLDAEVEEYAERFLVRLKEKSFGIVEVPEIPGSRELPEIYFTINQEIIPLLEEYLSYHGHDVTVQSIIDKIASPDVKELFQYAMENCPTEKECKNAVATREEAKKNLMTYFEDHRLDCIIVPANKIPPPTLRAFEDRNTELRRLITQNVDFGSNCNNPSLVIPGGIAQRSGVPFGMQIEGYTGSDRRVIAVAVAIEKALNL
ncbi:mandelamide hydrolase-like [Patiria miniata]|uniref:Amidase domain-containing protein n=1 Tax=Patiria miniata TaxID=46514 RepID=A0A914B4D5_PATMI|nr:mandelamide hydrolase-like [Patiria miniata]